MFQLRENLAQVEPIAMKNLRKHTKYDVEYTDTFGGYANYSWVRRETISVASDSCRTILREAKRIIGLTNVRGKTTDHGDTIVFRPYRMATVLYVTVEDR